MTLKDILTKFCFFATHKISDTIDYIFDKRVCGINLSKTKRCDNKEAHSSAPTTYIKLKSIFDKVNLSSTDFFMDVGCGKGRILAYLKKKELCQNIEGTEINQHAFDCVKQWTEKHPNIKCWNKNILDIPLNKYTILYLYNPFEGNTLQAFIKKIETEVNHPITLIYASDNEYGDILVQNSCWHLQNRFFCYRFGMIFFAPFPQRVSIWKYEPFQSKQVAENTASNFSVNNEDCKFKSTYYEKLRGIRKIGNNHAIYDDGSGDINTTDKQTYDEWFRDGQIEPSWDELSF